MKQDASSDKLVTLPHGERWLIDGFAVLPHPGGVISRICDMTRAKVVLETLRARGLPATWISIIIRAAALALHRVPEANQVVSGYRRMQPQHVDIGLSVAGHTSYAPVLVIRSAEERPLPELVSFLTEAVPATREKEVRDLAGMNRLGWIIPFGPLRRLILRLLSRSHWFRRRLVGTFQITCVPSVDWVIAQVFYSGAALSVGRIGDRVLAINGQPVVRTTAMFVVAIDHKTMDGRIASMFLDTMISVLEGDELLREAEGPLGHEAMDAIGSAAAAVPTERPQIAG